MGGVGGGVGGAGGGGGPGPKTSAAGVNPRPLDRILRSSLGGLGSGGIFYSPILHGFHILKYIFWSVSSCHLHHPIRIY